MCAYCNLYIFFYFSTSCVQWLNWIWLANPLKIIFMIVANVAIAFSFNVKIIFENINMFKLLSPIPANPNGHDILLTFCILITHKYYGHFMYTWPTWPKRSPFHSSQMIPIIMNIIVIFLSLLWVSYPSTTSYDSSWWQCSWLY